MNTRREMQQLVSCWSGTSKIDSKMGMIRTFQTSAKNIRLALNHNSNKLPRQRISRESADDRSCRSRMGLLI
jgi:hypothetical protein